VYSDINKKLPGPFNDPPTREEVEEYLAVWCISSSFLHLFFCSNNTHCCVFLLLVPMVATPWTTSEIANCRNIVTLAMEGHVLIINWEPLVGLSQTFDRNEDGMLDRTEFAAFLEKFTKNVSAHVSTNILIFSIVIPTIVVWSRPGAESLPLVGPIVRRAPNPIYSAVMTTLIVFAGSQFRKV
jgi:hypothetical protein